LLRCSHAEVAEAQQNKERAAGQQQHFLTCVLEAVTLSLRCNIKRGLGMLGLIVAFSLQAAAAEVQPAALETETAAPAEVQEAAPAAEAPPRKRVCRTVVDNRTGIMAKQRKVCHFVDPDENGGG
jgi:hypothetical protein